MEKEVILNLLKEEEYPDYMIEQTSLKLEKLQPVLSHAFDLWVNKGIVPTITIEGYSYEKLTSAYGMKPVGAFLTLDWLCREPDKALQSLRRGFR